MQTIQTPKHLSKLAWYCTLIAVVFAGIYTLTSWGTGQSLLPIIGSLGLVFCLLLSPLARYHAHTPIAVLGWLVLVSFIGLGLGDRAWLIGIPIAGWGFLLWCQLAVTQLKNGRSLHDLAIYALICISSFFLATRFWGVGYLSPLFDQNAATAAAHPDSLFQMAITSMIRTYGVPSTGVDDLVFLPYHTGSHWLFAGLANSLSLSTSTFFNLTYPILFVPLLVYTIWLAVQSLTELRQLNRQNAFNLPFPWLVLAVGLTGWIPLQFQNWLNTEVVFYISESYTVGLTVSLLLFSYLLQTHTKFWQPSRLLFFSCLVLCIGLIKISFLFIWLLPICYVFTVKKKYSSLIISGWLLGFWVATWYMYSTFSLSEHTPELRSLASIAGLLAQAKTWFWLITEYGLLALASLSRVYMEPNFSIRDWRRYWRRHTFLDLELLWIVALAGFLPHMLFELPGGIEQYFLDVQRWGALIVVLVHLPQTFTHQKIVAGVLGGILLLNIIISGYWYVQLVLNRRQRMLDLYGQLVLPPTHLITHLQELDSVLHSEKKYLQLSISPSSSYWSLLNNCQSLPLIAPALSGIVLVNGLADPNCSYVLYGYQIFDTENTPDINLSRNTLTL